MELFQCTVADIDKAWRDGAHKLSEACARAKAEVTPDQLKMLLSYGERILIGCRDEDGVKGWAAVQVQQMPNLRVLHVYSLWSPGAATAEVLEKLKEYARFNGCSSIRGACDEVISRLWKIKFKAHKVYNIMEFEV